MFAVVYCLNSSLCVTVGVRVHSFAVQRGKVKLRTVNDITDWQPIDCYAQLTFVGIVR